MKNLIALIVIGLLILSFPCNAQQTVKVDVKGNYTAVSKSLLIEPFTSTGKTFTDTKGNKYPVMVSKNGKLFYVRTSKAGNEYKVYIKLS